MIDHMIEHKLLNIYHTIITLFIYFISLCDGMLITI
jgi:hypothetical protein